MDEEAQERVGQLFREHRRERTLREVEEAAGVNKQTVSQIEKLGVYDGLRALDLFKLAAYYGIDVRTIVGLLGYTADQSLPDRLQPLLREFTTLDESDQEYVVGVLDVLLRGMRRRA